MLSREDQPVIPPVRLSSTLAADVAGGLALPQWLRPLDPASSVAARAVPLWIQRNDNLGLRQFIASGSSYDGSMLVIAGASESNTAVIGDVTARKLRDLGIIGIITDGPVRDRNELVALGFHVWSRGVTTMASAKLSSPPRANFVVIGGIPVYQDDLVIADVDGVIVWPSALVSDYMRRAASLDGNA